MKINKNLHKEIINYNLDYIELLALLNNIKPLVFCTICQAQKNNLIKLMKKLNLYYRFVTDPIIEEKSEMSSSEGEFLIISKEIEKVNNFINVYFGDNHEKKFTKVGELLGYPKCCAFKYINYIFNDGSPQRLRNYYYQATKKSQKFHSLINPLFSFYGRISSNEFVKLRSFSEKNKSLNIQELMLISHAPCSFNCIQSIEYAKKIYSVLKRENKIKANKIIKILSNPVLFFDTFEFIVFNGKANKKEIIYNNICPPFSLVSDKIIKKIKQGNRLLVNDVNIQIYIDKKKIYTIKKESVSDGFIIPFSKNLIKDYGLTHE